MVDRKKLVLLLCSCVVLLFVVGLSQQSVYIYNLIRIKPIGSSKSPKTGSQDSTLSGSIQETGSALVRKLCAALDTRINVTVVGNATALRNGTVFRNVTNASNVTSEGRLKIAVLIPSTSRSIPKDQFFTKSSLVTVALPALCKTMEASLYDYSIYLGIDKGDYMETLLPELENLTSLLIPVVANSSNFVQCANAIAERAYDDGMDYFVRINDDSLIMTEGWTTIGIEKLRSYKPPNIGVVGPTCNQGNTDIMTHDMVHRTHLNIFSHYYPAEFTNWWIDDWITVVYQPHRSTKLANWTVVHPMTHGTRYKVNDALKNRLKLIDSRDRPKIMGFVYPKRYVVSFSLFGSDTRYTEGALANAELMPTVYPGWVMRVYHNNVSKPILANLSQYDFVHLISVPKSAVSDIMLRYLVASDPEVNVYVIRDIDARVTAREKAAVDKWLESDKQFHVMRDHPEQTKYAMTGGLWGGRKGAIPNIGQLMSEMKLEPNQSENSYFLNDVIWPIVKKSVLQHDSFSCKKYGEVSSFPTPRQEQEFVGSKYVDGKVNQMFIDALKSDYECV